MSVRGLGDAYAFQRLVWLVIGTVLVPTALLAVYGVFAVRNTRAAILQREMAERERQLQAVAAEMVHALDGIDEAVHARVATCGDTCRIEVPGVAETWIWPAGGATPLDLAPLGLPAGVGGDTVWITPADGSPPVGVFRANDRMAAWRLDIEHVEEQVRDAARGRFEEEATIALERARPATIPSMDDLMRQLQAPTVETTLALAPPLANWGLTVRSEDPGGSVAWLYLLGLIVLVATVVTGAVFTLNATRREIRLSRLQTDFVSSISHELRTPLTSIRMFVETLQSGRLEDPGKVDEVLGMLAEESDRLSRRIERVLHWARMEAGRRIYEVEDVQPREIVDEVLQAVRAQHVGREQELDAAIEIALPEGLPPLRVDRDAIVEAMLNLVTNAVKHSEPPRRIVLSATQQGGQVGLSVADNGPGIERRDRRRIWERFYQGENLLSRKTGGSGLGLAIVQAVVQGHGGQVDLDTELDRGSTFTLWLPTGGVRK